MARLADTGAAPSDRCIRRRRNPLCRTQCHGGVAPHAIADAELRRAIRKPPESLDAWAAYQRGLWHLSKANSEDDTIAQNFFRQAIDLDPTFAPGYSALALAQLQAAAVYQKLSLAEAQSSAEAL